MLKKQRRILDKKYPNIIAAINNLAQTLRDQSQFKKTAKMKKKVLKKIRRILDKEHPNTIIAINNLVITLKD
jgi:hypothetical protein